MWLAEPASEYDWSSSNRRGFAPHVAPFDVASNLGIRADPPPRRTPPESEHPAVLRDANGWVKRREKAVAFVECTENRYCVPSFQAHECDPDLFYKTLSDFQGLVADQEPAEVQRLLRLMVKRVDWSPEGTHKVHFDTLPKARETQKISPLSQPGSEDHWFDLNSWSGAAGRRRTSPCVTRISRF